MTIRPGNVMWFRAGMAILVRIQGKPQCHFEGALTRPEDHRLLSSTQNHRPQGILSHRSPRPVSRHAPLEHCNRELVAPRGLKGSPRDRIGAHASTPPTGAVERSDFGPFLLGLGDTLFAICRSCGCSRCSLRLYISVVGFIRQQKEAGGLSPNDGGKIVGRFPRTIFAGHWSRAFAI